jgi:hypothetical protein
MREFVVACPENSILTASELRPRGSSHNVPPRAVIGQEFSLPVRIFESAAADSLSGFHEQNRKAVGGESL